MSVITSISKNRRAQTAAVADRQPSEFDGLWINPGIMVGEGDDAKFVRLPRGIAVDDLKTRKIYDSMDPEFAAEVAVMNEVVTELQNAALKLEEGESLAINLELRLYRKQEESEVQADPEITKTVRSALFGN